MTTRLSLASHRKTLATRPLAVELRSVVQEAAVAGETITLDFEGVLAVSSSFADELVGQLGEIAAQVEGKIQVENASEEVLSIVEKTVAHRQVESSVMLPSHA